MIQDRLFCHKEACAFGSRKAHVIEKRKILPDFHHLLRIELGSQKFVLDAHRTKIFAQGS